MLPIYIDIDNTLTIEDKPNAPVIESRIKFVRRLIESRPVVIWSARGTRYARDFCARHALSPFAVLGKPDFCVDDKAEIRQDGLRVIGPQWLDRGHMPNS